MAEISLLPVLDVSHQTSVDSICSHVPLIQTAGGRQCVEVKWGRFSDTAFIRCISTGRSYKIDMKCVCYSYENK